MTAAIDHAHRSHALLSASGAAKWLHCPPSAQLEAKYPDRQTEYTREGTLAHEIAELKLRNYFLEPMSSREYKKRMAPFKANPLYADEMEVYTDEYRDYVKSLSLACKDRPFVAIEQQIDYSDVAPGGFGTVDCLLVEGDTMYVNDFKYGKGVLVSAEHNPQMMLYAVGALKRYGLFYPIKNVHLAIIQPRLKNISKWQIPRNNLEAWAENIVTPAAAKAAAGKGEFAAGDWCRFCRAKVTCRAYANKFLSLEKDFGAPAKKPETLSPDELASVLERGADLVNWYNAVKEHALSECLSGRDIPGYKAVEGRGSRAYVDIDKAFAHLTKAGIDEAMLYERRPLTVPKMEKAIGKKQYQELLEAPGLVEKRPGKPTLAPVTDKRPSITNTPDPAKEFNLKGE